VQRRQRVRHDDGIPHVYRKLTVQPATSPCIGYEVTYKADIFANPPLGAEQQVAEDELLKTATLEFWEKAARDNGISD
jgi:hypothetical protein